MTISCSKLTNNMKKMHYIHLVNHHGLKSLSPLRSDVSTGLPPGHPQFSVFLFLRLLAPKYTTNIPSGKTKTGSFSRAANCSALWVIVRLGERKELFSSTCKNLAGFREPFQLSSGNSQNEFDFTGLKFNVSQKRPKDRSTYEDGKALSRLKINSHLHYTWQRLIIPPRELEHDSMWLIGSWNFTLQYIQLL